MSRHSKHSKKKPAWQLLVRSVDGPNIPIIARDKAILPQISKSWIPGIYTHYLSDQLDTNFLSQWAFLDWMRSYHIVLVFDPKILKDLPFSVCDWMNYGECIDPSVSKEKRNKHLILHSKGKRSSIPDMTPLVKHINKMISEIVEEEEDEEEHLSTFKRWLQTVKQFFKKKENKIVSPTYYEFVSSHEVIFDYIPLKYIKAIVVHDIRHKKAIEFYLPRIPIVMMPHPNPDQKDTDYIKKTVFPTLKRIAKM